MQSLGQLSCKGCSTKCELPCWTFTLSLLWTVSFPSTFTLRFGLRRCRHYLYWHFHISFIGWVNRLLSWCASHPIRCVIFVQPLSSMSRYLWPYFTLVLVQLSQFFLVLSNFPYRSLWMRLFSVYCAWLSACLFFVSAISLKSLSLWNCTRVGPHSYLTNDLSVLCEGPKYKLASAVNVFFCLVIVVGYSPPFIHMFLVSQCSEFLSMHMVCLVLIYCLMQLAMLYCLVPSHCKNGGQVGRWPSSRSRWFYLCAIPWRISVLGCLGDCSQTVPGSFDRYFHEPFTMLFISRIRCVFQVTVVAFFAQGIPNHTFRIHDHVEIIYN